MKIHDMELGEKNQSEKCLPHKHEDLSSDHQNSHKEIKSQGGMFLSGLPHKPHGLSLDRQKLCKARCTACTWNPGAPVPGDGRQRKNHQTPSSQLSLAKTAVNNTEILFQTW